MAKKICLGCMEQYEDSLSICPFCGFDEKTGPVEAYHIMPGTVLQGKYIVGKSIGYGGFGVTYIGYDFALDHKVAIKEYLPGEFSTRCIGETKVTVFEGEKREQFNSGIDKFIDEAKRLANYKNVDGIVTVYDSFKENDTAYIVMEYLEGKTLKEVIAEKGKIGFDTAVGYIVPILDALTEVHKDGLLHRDISPDNIFITNDGRVKLIDFGAARYATTTHSKSLSVIVKPGYAPQEQYRSRGDQGPWTDVYACAATLYKMITGITPEDSMERGERDSLKPPRKAGAKIPKNKQNAIMNALNLKVEDRTQSPAEFKKELLSENWVQRKKNTLKKMDIGMWPLWVKITSGIGTAAVITTLILLLTGVISFQFINGRLHFMVGKGKTIVPNVVNYTEEEASTIAEKQNMVLQANNSVEDDEVVKGIILSQAERAGNEVPEKTILFVTVSAGKGQVMMSDYAGLEEEAVKADLEKVGLPYITESAESEVAPGYVFEQSIAEGTKVEKGSEVRIKVSSGISSYDSNKDTTVPNLIGKSWDDGRKTIREKNLYIIVVGQEYSYDIPAGQIFEQDHEADSKVKEGEIIGVKISLGIKKIIVPDVYLKYQEDAVKLIEAEGLAVKIEYEDSDTVAKDHVIRQSIEAGTEIEVTKDGKPVEITIYISNGIDGVIPDVTGRTKEEAEKMIKNSGYTLGNISYQEGTSKSKDGTVVKQSPISGRKAKAGTSVSITLYKYVEETDPVNAKNDDRVEVPDVTGMQIDAAKEKLKNADLSGSVISYESGSDNNKSDQVLSQNVSAGSKVEKGTSIGLVVYRYEEQTTEATTTEQVVDGPTDDSTTEDTETTIEITEDTSKSTEDTSGSTEDTSKSTEDTSGSTEDTSKSTEDTSGTTETTEIAKPKKVTVPDVKGLSREDAINKIEAKGLKVEIKEKWRGDDDASSLHNKVIGQNPEKGESIEKGKTVTITICMYSNPHEGQSKVPNVIGDSYTDAASKLAFNGLELGDVSYKSDPKKTDGTVISQSVDAGEYVMTGASIDIVICNNSKEKYYRTRTISYVTETTTSKGSLGSDWEYVSEVTDTSYGDYSDWSTNAIAESDTVHVETKNEQVLTKYHMHTWYIENQGSRTYFNHAPNSTASYVYDNSLYVSVDDFSYWRQVPSREYSHGGIYEGFNLGDTVGYYEPDYGKIYFIERNIYENRTYYRSCPIITTTTYTYRKTVYSDWSSWSTNPRSEDDTTQVETKEVYWDKKP